MNYRAIVELYVEKNGRPYVLHLPVGAPFDECREALSELTEGITFLEQQAKDQAAQAASQKNPEPVTAEITD